MGSTSFAVNPGGIGVHGDLSIRTRIELHLNRRGPQSRACASLLVQNGESLAYLKDQPVDPSAMRIVSMTLLAWITSNSRP
jgi:hypothetical protein